MFFLMFRGNVSLFKTFFQQKIIAKKEYFFYICPHLCELDSDFSSLRTEAGFSKTGAEVSCSPPLTVILSAELTIFSDFTHSASGGCCDITGLQSPSA